MYLSSMPSLPLEMEAKMSRVALPLSCTAEVMQELERLSKSRTDESRLVERAKMVLRCLAGERNDEVAARLGTGPATVGAWRRRLAHLGRAGPKDRPPPGKPSTLPPAFRQRRRAQL